jgi:outer membrane beta-barrel protein
MKHARVWLLATAAFALSAPAFAQAKPGKKPPTNKAAPAAAGGGDIELDEKPTDKPADPAAGAEAPPSTTPEGGGTGGGICDVDATAPGCAKDPVAAAAKAKSAAGGGDSEKVNENRVWAVQQIYAMKKGRFELNPYWSFSLNDQFVNHPGPGLAANYYLSNVLAIGANFNYYGAFNVDSEFNFQNRRATRVAVPLNEYLMNVSVDATYVPVYGKFASIGDFIFHYDAYTVLGLGAIWTRPIAVIDPDNRSFSYSPKLAANVGIGLRIFFNRWFAATAEIRDYVYSESVENIKVGKNQAEQQDKATWTDKNFNLTNNIQAQLGVSIFLPFSFKYELAK